MSDLSNIQKPLLELLEMFRNQDMENEFSLDQSEREHYDLLKAALRETGWTDDLKREDSTPPLSELIAKLSTDDCEVSPAHAYQENLMREVGIPATVSVHEIGSDVGYLHSLLCATETQKTNAYLNALPD